MLTSPPSQFVAACSLAIAVSIPAFAQSRQVPAPPQKQPIVFHSATIHTCAEQVEGSVIENGYLVFENGRITDIGTGAAPTVPDAKVVNATGMHLYPGLVSSMTQLGVSEIGAVDVTLDYAETGRVKPEVRAAVAVNPDSDLIPVARSNGILLATVAPTGGLVAGRASAIRLDGWTWENMTIDDAVGLVINWPRTEPIRAFWMERSEEDQNREISESLLAIERVFDDAAAYLKAKDAGAELAGRMLGSDTAQRETRVVDEQGRVTDLTTDLRYEAMRPFLSGARPIYVSASMAGQIEAAVAWAARRKLSIIIFDAHQADRCTALLKANGVPVIIGGIHRTPNRPDDDYDQPFALPAKLHEAGVKFAIAAAGEPAHDRNISHMAATASAYGLPKDQAIRAITLYAAQLAGIGADYGSLEEGKSATLIVTTGDPLEITTDVLAAYIDGRTIDMGDRQKELYEKYRAKYRQLGLIEN